MAILTFSELTLHPRFHCSIVFPLLFFLWICLSRHWMIRCSHFWHDRFSIHRCISCCCHPCRCTSLNVIRDPYSTNRPGLVSIIPDVSPTPVRPPLAPLSQLQENAFPGEHFNNFFNPVFCHLPHISEIYMTIFASITHEHTHRST